MIESTIISNEISFSNKKTNFIKNSNNSNTIILTDFDYTISKRYVNNNNNLNEYYSTYCFIEQSDLSKKINLLEKINKLKEKYLSYETNTNISYKEREEKIKEWFIKTFELYIKCNFTYFDLENIVNEGLNKKDKFFFKDYFFEYFNKLIELNFTIVVVSGGIKEIIEILFKKFIKNYESLKKNKKIIILANYFIFNKSTGVIEKYNSDDLIFTFNKSIEIKKLIDKQFKNIQYILLFGDHLNDIDMIKDLNILKENIISFGFINGKINNNGDNYNEESKKQIELYKQTFDVNILNDSYLFIIDILNQIYFK